MNSRPDLVGVVASARALGSVGVLAGVGGAVPVLLGRTGGLGGGTLTALAVVLFGVPFAWFTGPRRAWYRERLEAAVPTPAGAVVVARDEEFHRVTQPLTKGVVAVLVVELAFAFATGIPIGLALSGLGAGMLVLARWLAAEERLRGVRLVCPAAAGRVAADDPHLADYRAVPFYTVPVPADAG